jgi:uncharacterized protein (TIGR03435 family)
MTKRLSCFLVLAMCLGSASPTHSQGQDSASRLVFDVAAIRPSKPGQRGGGIKALPGGNGYIAQNIPVKLMISLMYRVPMRQIIGGPSWLDSDTYDVQAKVDRSYDIDDLHIMFQNLLAERFNLKLHKETKEGPVYALRIDTPGSKMKVNESAQDYKIPLNFGPDGAVGVRVPMPYLCWWLGQQLQSSRRPVIDLTGLSKNYDFTLSFLPELPPDVSPDSLAPEIRDRPPLLEAVKEQLGLKLVPERGPIEQLVIDHIERPSEN